VDGAGLRLRQVDKLRQGAHAKGWSDVDQRGCIADQRNGGKVADRIERQVLVQRSQDGMTGIGEQDGVAVAGAHPPPPPPPCATGCAAMRPPAPGRFATMTCWPNRFDSLSAKSRARMSMVVPAVKGTTTVIIREGYCSCAAAGAPTAIAVASTAVAKFTGFIPLLPSA